MVLAMGMGPMSGWGRGYCRPRGFGARRMGFDGYGRGVEDLVLGVTI